MIKVYRSVWNDSLQAWVAVPETGRARKKTGGAVLMTHMAAVMLLGGLGEAWAGPPDGEEDDATRRGRLVMPATAPYAITRGDARPEGWAMLDPGVARKTRRGTPTPAPTVTPGAAERSHAVRVDRLSAGSGLRDGDGAFVLARAGGGARVLRGESLFGGGIRIDRGMTGVGSDRALGSGPVVLAGGGLDFIKPGVTLANPIEFEQTARMHVGPADSRAWLTGALSGPGGIDKTGQGALIVSGRALDYRGDTRVREGTMIFNADAPNTRVTVDHGAVLGGSGRIGFLDAHGEIDPAGDATGPLSVLHDAVLYADATYRVATVTPEGETDVLHAGGKMDIQGAQLKVVARSGEYKPRTTYKIASADGGLTGRFGDMSLNLPYLRGETHYDANAAYMTLMRNGLDYGTLPGLAENPKNAGGGLDGMPDNPLTRAIQSLTDPDARSALGQLSGESYASLQNATRSSLAQFMSGVWGKFGGMGEEGCVKCEQDPAQSGWVMSSVLQGSVKGNGQTSGFRNDGYGVMAGLDRPVAANLRLGLAAGLTRATQTTLNLPSKATLDTGMLALTGQYDLERFWVAGLVGVGYGRLSNERNIRFPGYQVKTKGSGAVKSAFARVGVGYRMALSEAVMLEPLLSLDVSRAHTGEIVETGGDDANLRVGASTASVAASEAGARISGYFDTESGQSVALEGTVLWRHQLTRPAATQKAAFMASSAAAQPYRGATPAADSALLGLSVKIGLNRLTELSFGYQGQFGGGQTGNGIMGQYHRRW